MQKLPEMILQRSQSLPEGEVLSPKEFLSAGSRAAVDQAFSRLARRGKLLRICRGMYVAPVKSRFGTRAPEPEKVIQSLAQKTSEPVTSSGARAANGLGLTQQVPVRQVFLTSGRARTLRLGKSEIQINHAPRWMLSASAAGEAVRAFAWLGETQSRSVIHQLHKRLPEAEWAKLMGFRAVLPSWMARMIGSEALCG
ncbi:hypothetical protein EXN22_23355 [Pseudomonas tructae]|uniref:Type IV toxin-antitoxin system AbiEi family antitoxin domain-containing protein n=1 Tax=Pseudomonas tructae TaxID=2518644 RepID=A0A411MNT9_9PSED|nr:DUF6088 family protein [Pseudomonas tructae]QBF28485.1 hypothetical protein EXN22_23355 [Pseudomonas tructae]